MAYLWAPMGVFRVSEPPLTPLRSSYGVFRGPMGVLGSQSPPTPLIPFYGAFRGHMGVFGVPIGVFWVSEPPPTPLRSSYGVFRGPMGVFEVSGPPPGPFILC